jgi:hypothetical protein
MRILIPFRIQLINFDADPNADQGYQNDADPDPQHRMKQKYNNFRLFRIKITGTNRIIRIKAGNILLLANTSPGEAQALVDTEIQMQHRLL